LKLASSNATIQTKNENIQNIGNKKFQWLLLIAGLSTTVST
jgi:hypothetical protein